MKFVEIQFRSRTAEMEKLLARKARCEVKLEKAVAKVEKLNCKWTNEEHNKFMETVESVDGWMTNKEEIKKNSAWWDWVRARRDLEEVNEKIENASARLDKAQIEVDEYHKMIAVIEDAKRREELWQKEFEAEQKEWAKDGIDLVSRYNGFTPSGKRFTIYGNSGVTIRSRHCFTLYIDGEVIFTSGEFWRCYLNIKNS